MSVDWTRLKAVVIESDDWGLCAWVPDEDAYQALAGTPAWRSAPGRRYGRSTLESAVDVTRLNETLLGVRGGDGFPPVWQANTVMAAPDYERLAGPDFEAEPFPVVALPDLPSRWQRPGLWGAFEAAIAAGSWWPELHGLHHIPVSAWLDALRAGEPDALLAHQHQSMVCTRVEASGEYDSSEPDDLRRANLERAFDSFTTAFGRQPLSLCAPDYRWDDLLEREAERRDVILQGKAEQSGSGSAWSRWFQPPRGLATEGGRFYMPARIPFEPRGDAGGAGRLGAEVVHRKVLDAWKRGEPAIISSHRLNYAHLDEEWSEEGRATLTDLLGRLASDQAIFLIDAEVRELTLRGWSARPVGENGTLVRVYSDTAASIMLEAPERATGVSMGKGRGSDKAPKLTGGVLLAELGRGEYLLEWGFS